MAVQLPVHVWVRRDLNTEVPGLLITWQRQGSEWWGNVAMVDEAGDPAVALIRADLLRVAETRQ